MHDRVGMENASPLSSKNSALVMGRVIPLTAMIRKAETFAKVPQIPKCLGRALGIWGILKVLGRLKLRYRKFQTALGYSLGLKIKKRLESSSLTFHFHQIKKYQEWRKR